MKIRNLTMNVDDAKEMHRLVDEYKFIGRECVYDAQKLTVTLLALPSEYKKKRERDARVAAKREREEDGYEQYQ